MRRNSRWEGFPGGKELPVGRISWWEGIPGGKNLLVRKISRRERFLCGDYFPVTSNDKDFQERNISQTWKSFPGVKDFPE